MTNKPEAFLPVFAPDAVFERGRVAILDDLNKLASIQNTAAVMLEDVGRPERASAWRDELRSTEARTNEVRAMPNPCSPASLNPEALGEFIAEHAHGDTSHSRLAALILEGLELVAPKKPDPGPWFLARHATRTGMYVVREDGAGAFDVGSLTDNWNIEGVDGRVDAAYVRAKFTLLRAVFVDESVKPWPVWAAPDCDAAEEQARTRGDHWLANMHARRAEVLRATPLPSW